MGFPESRELQMNNTKDFPGYASPDYALSLKEFGEPYELPRCGGWILVRPIPGTPYKDAIGCYPLFACRDWTKIHEDLEHVGPDLISLSLVIDPFAAVTPPYFEQHFDLVKPFKTHYMVDLSCPLESFILKLHQKKARKSLELMDIEVCYQPIQYLDNWITLYDNLIGRHNIRGISTFSPKCFEIQLNIPGMVMFLGRRGGEIVGANLVLIHDQVAHSHLAAYTSEGYKIKASFGILWKVLTYVYEQGIRYINLGGAAGLKDDLKSGLARFKRGWSNERRTVYFCSRIFDRQRYESICQQYQTADAEYFPPYRVNEFNVDRVENQK